MFLIKSYHIANKYIGFVLPINVSEYSKILHFFMINSI